MIAAEKSNYYFCGDLPFSIWSYEYVEPARREKEMETICTLPDPGDHSIAIITFQGLTGSSNLGHQLRKCEGILWVDEGYDDVYLEAVKHVEYSRLDERVNKTTGTRANNKNRYVLTKSQNVHTLALLPQNTKVIHITWNDKLLRGLSSLLRSMHDSKEGYFQCLDDKSCKFPTSPIDIDVNRFMTHVDSETQKENIRVQLLKGMEFTETLNIRFEDMIESEYDGINKILNFLELDCTIDNLGPSKAAIHTIKQAILNHQDLVDHIRSHAEYHDYLPYLDTYS